MSRLALFGGPRTIQFRFAPFYTIGEEEIRSVEQVLRSGELSGFLGSWNDRFFGGPQVRAFEEAWSRTFRTDHAVSFNSLTSALVAAVGAVGVEPGDEVIVSPWTMCATATAILFWNAIPVFADIDEETFNLDPAAVEKCITPRTKAIMVTDIFGHPARLDAILDIAEAHGLKVIEDAAQAPYARYRDRFAGTVGHIGGFSLNCHKHIQTGEGGVAVTGDPELAQRMRLIRNHGEAVVGSMGLERIDNILGLNLRMCEIEAAIALTQLGRLPGIAAQRIRVGALLTRRLESLKGLRMPQILKGCDHVFYMFPMILDSAVTGVGRARILEALSAEGTPFLCGGYQLLHELPLYQQRIAYGSKGFPWTAEFYKGNVSYARGICPVAERLHHWDFIGLQLSPFAYGDEEVEAVAHAFHKVWDNLDALAEWDG